MNAFTPKNYQKDALDMIVEFFQECRRQNSAAAAYAKVTEDRYQQSLGYRPLQNFEKGMPYFCLRVPTGGGKTWLAAKSVKLINRYLLQNEYSVILWLTPGNAICSQTLAGLKNPEHPLCAALEEAGPVTVLSLDEAKSVTRATLDTSTVVIVATRQSFQVENERNRKVYESSGELLHHFDNLPEEAKAALLHEVDGNGNDTAPYSLVNVLRLRRPFVIVDEAHNNRTPLAFDTISKFRPSGIMELTATPDTSKNPSNVLLSVSAVELKNEEMIKLPIVLQTVSDWRQCLADAINCRNRLQAEADSLWELGQERHKPVMLIQAEARSKDKETLHADAIKDELVNNQNVPEKEICIATGDEKGLAALDAEYEKGINDPGCPVKYVITQKALAEGWDCPWAYVLVSVANVHSATAVEQLLGRILRQPDAQRKKSDALNKSYAFVVSQNFRNTAAALRDQLVAVAGFERNDASRFVVSGNDGKWLSLLEKGITIELPGDCKVGPVPPALAKKVAWNEKNRSLTISATLDENELKAVRNMVEDVEAKEKIVNTVKQAQGLQPPQKTPSELGERVQVPQLSLLTLFNGVERREPFIDAGAQLKPKLAITPKDVEPDGKDLSALAVKAGERGAIDVNQEGRIVDNFLEDVQLSLDIAYAPENWDEIRLAAWLCKQIDTRWMPHDLKMKFVLAWLQKLINNPDFPLSRAVRQKAVIRGLLEKRLEGLRLRAINTAGQYALFTPEGQSGFRVDAGCVFEFPPNNYYPATVYDPNKSKWGPHEFKHHYYPQIGEFDSKEEFECAVFIDNEAIKGNIKYWIRNLVRAPSSFSLTKIEGKFYPDFVCILPDDKNLVIEYKGADRWNTDKVKADREIGKLWADLSGGKCKFVMIKNKDWNSILLSLFN